MYGSFRNHSKLLASWYGEHGTLPFGLMVHATNHSACQTLVQGQLHVYEINVRLNLSLQRVEEGADSILHLAVAPELEQVTGKYFWDCRPSFISRQAKDAAFAEKFWKLSEELTDLESSKKNRKDK